MLRWLRRLPAWVLAVLTFVWCGGWGLVLVALTGQTTGYVLAAAALPWAVYIGIRTARQRRKPAWDGGPPFTADERDAVFDAVRLGQLPDQSRIRGASLRMASRFLQRSAVTPTSIVVTGSVGLLLVAVTAWLDLRLAPLIALATVLMAVSGRARLRFQRGAQALLSAEARATGSGVNVATALNRSTSSSGTGDEQHPSVGSGTD